MDADTDSATARWSRRRFLKVAGAAAGSSLIVMGAPAWAGSGPAGPGYLTTSEVSTLNAALARLIPASGPGDWSAADLGVATYIDNILSGFDEDAATGQIFAGGPYREASNAGGGFDQFQTLSRVKATGWKRQVAQWQRLYRSGLAGLDSSAGGRFGSAPSVLQDAILAELDSSGSAFFSALYDHTMEGAYAHPVYGGNAGYRAWQSVGFAGDVHGVRFPTIGSRGAWNVYGGYSPEEIVAVGSAVTEQPVTGPARGGTG